jgi:hypothetical protein
MSSLPNTLPVGNVVLPSPLQSALVQAIGRKCSNGPRPDPGQYTLRGSAVLSVDCTLAQSADSLARDPITLDPVRLLAYALAYAHSAGVPADRLPGIAAQSAKMALAQYPAPDVLSTVATGSVGSAKSERAASAPRTPKTGACTVKGSVGIVCFNPR